MRFFVLAVVTLAAAPLALSQPIKVERTHEGDVTAIAVPHEAREPQPTLYDVIERSTMGGENSSELEARFFLCVKWPYPFNQVIEQTEPADVSSEQNCWKTLEVS
ncbi:hypothetical protein H0H92_003447 [Tricholoma furcatifolium]|nr:hypothetical protein H0H92_003447 [Tricholoma furcatifolium]